MYTDGVGLLLLFFYYLSTPILWIRVCDFFLAMCVNYHHQNP